MVRRMFRFICNLVSDCTVLRESTRVLHELLAYHKTYTNDEMNEWLRISRA